MKKTRSANAYVCGFLFEILISLIVFGDIWGAGADSAAYTRHRSGAELSLVYCYEMECNRVLNAILYVSLF